MFGIEFARLYVSGNLDSVAPMAHAITAMRPNPVKRDSAVPMLIANVARASDGAASEAGIASSGPVRGGDGSREDIRARVSAGERSGGRPFVHLYAVSAGDVAPSARASAFVRFRVRRAHARNRNSVLPPTTSNATVLTAVDRRTTLPRAINRPPSGVSSRTSRGNDPAARASTVKSTVSLGGFTCVSCVAPLGNPTFALSTLTRSRTGNAFVLMTVTGTLPDFAVSVTRRPEPT